MVSAQLEKDIISLRNGISEAIIWPTCGGILNAWHQQLPGIAFNAIDGYIDFEDFRRHGEEKGFRSMKLSPFVCRMRGGQFHFDNVGYKIQKFYLGEEAIHGIIYDAAYNVESCETNGQVAVAILSYTYRGTDAGYPFPYAVKLQYALHPDNRLELTTVLTNLADTTIPIADGWHPYFSLIDKVDALQLQMFATQMVEFDAGLLPTGGLLPEYKYLDGAPLQNINLDNCFLLDAPGEGVACYLQNSGYAVRLEILPDSSYPYLQVYTPPHRNSIAIENLTSAPDAFNNGMGLLQLPPGEQKSFTTSYRISQH